MEVYEHETHLDRMIFMAEWDYLRGTGGLHY